MISVPQGQHSAWTRKVSFDLSHTPPGSCAVYGCVGYNSSHACQCNDMCKHFGSCCRDFADKCPDVVAKSHNATGVSVLDVAKAPSKLDNATIEESCAAFGCVGYTPSNSCQCNSLCKHFENCCKDYVSQCKTGTADEQNTAGEENHKGRHEEKNEGNYFCCMWEMNRSNVCGSCPLGAQEGPGSWCGESEERCSECGKTWCSTNHTLAHVIMRKNREGWLRQANEQPFAARVALPAVAGIGAFGGLAALFAVARTVRPQPLAESLALLAHCGQISEQERPDVEPMFVPEQEHFPEVSA